MRKKYSRAIFTVFATGLLILFYACSKEEDKMIPPILEFKTGAGYTSADTTVAVSTPVKVGIRAEKTEGEDYLKTFTVSHSFDGASNVQDSTRILDESEYDVFNVDINFTTSSVQGTESYYFTITNRDGLIVTDTIVLTVE
jgi:hypothetical protein